MKIAAYSGFAPHRIVGSAHKNCTNLTALQDLDEKSLRQTTPLATYRCSYDDRPFMLFPSGTVDARVESARKFVALATVMEAMMAADAIEDDLARRFRIDPPWSAPKNS